MADILLVEPDAVLGKTYQSALQKAGHSVKRTHGAQSAVHEIDKHTPKLIITELQLAEHNGVEFLYELRSYPDWQDIPIFVLTSVPEPESGMSREVKNKLNIMKYLYKPQATLQQLITSIDEVITHETRTS